MDQKDFELLEKYLLGRMSPEEASLFEIRLEKEPELSAEKQEMEDALMAIEYSALKDTLGDFEVPYEADETGKGVTGGAEPPKKGRIISMRMISVAASMLIFGFALYFIVQKMYSPGVDFQEIFYKDPGLPTVMSETDRYLFYDAMVDYKAGKYETALEKWQNTSDVGLDTLDYYSGMALLNMGNWEEARVELEKVPEESSLYDKSNWYRVYILLYQKEYEAASTLLTEVPDTFEGYQNVREYLSKKQ